jgi:hypothetical protein
MKSLPSAITRIMKTAFRCVTTVRKRILPSGLKITRKVAEHMTVIVIVAVVEIWFKPGSMGEVTTCPHTSTYEKQYVS